MWLCDGLRADVVDQVVMVLADLGGRLQSALRALSTVSVVDEDMFKSLLASIQRALLQADVNVRLVGQLCNSIKSKASIEDMAAGHNRRAVIQKAVFESLCELLDPGKEPFKPVRGKPNVIMFVGLQGSGKTTSCTKLAYWYQKRVSPLYSVHTLSELALLLHEFLSVAIAIRPILSPGTTLY